MCFYYKHNLPVAGQIYIFNDYVCFDPKINVVSQKDIILSIKNLIYCELNPNIMGVALVLTTSDQSAKHGPVFQFSNMGRDSGNMACYLIQEMMDGIRSNNERNRLEADIQIADIERE